jgi:predicted NBD/HSP70 family sugar kinase
MRKIDLNNFRVARSDTARDINRRIVLNLVRKHQPVSRAGLARHSGLQRSTVSAIAEQLIAEQWLTECAIGQLPRGRKPTYLNLNGTRAGIIGVDIRPVTTNFALAGIDTHFIVQESMPTGDDPVEFVTRLTRRLCDLMKAHPKTIYEGIGISLPGRVNSHSQQLEFAPNLGWSGLDLKTPLERATGLPVELENAANACALAEFWYGKNAEGARNLIAVTVSEGIGVGMILNGQLVHGSTGVAGEFGHVAVDPKGPLCRCGNHGCWEMLGSNSAAVRYYTEGSTDRKGPAMTHSTTALAFGDLLRLAEQGDVKAGAALDKMAHHLGAGLAMLVTGLAPEAILVVGDVTRAWSRVGPIITKMMKERSFTRATTRIIPTDPAEQPRLRGTVALVLQKHFSAPTIA